MKTSKALWASVCVLLVGLFTVSAAKAAPVQTITSGGDFFVSSVVEVPGSSTVYVYGSSSRDNSQAARMLGVLTTNDNFNTNPVWTTLTGIVGYEAGTLNYAFVPCPDDLSCGGYKGFYILATSMASKIYRCTGKNSPSDFTGCAEWIVTGMTNYSKNGIGLNKDGTKVLVAGFQLGDSKSQIYALDIAGSTATKPTNCSNISWASGMNGSVAGSGSEQHLYVTYDNAGIVGYYRFTWNGSACTDSRALISGAMGWDNALDSAGADNYAAVGALTGTFYASRSNGDFVISRKDANCGDTFVSGGEVCDVQLNGQTCLTVPGGFTGGDLSCSGSCTWNTSLCTGGAPVCNNGIKEGSEECDGSDYGGATCASVMGAGYTGSLTCTSCVIGTANCVAPPTCGDTTCNGSETCSTCPGDCGACCGNGDIDPSEQCDGLNLNGGTCATVLGAGWSGNVSCNGSCQFVTSACIAPPTCNDGNIDVGEECDGAQLGGATCVSVNGNGWTGAVTCNGNCTLNTSNCTFPWGLKNLTGQCSIGGSGASQSVVFSGAICSGEYWPIGAVQAVNLQWAAAAGKVLLVGVMASGQPTIVTVPQGVSHSSVVDNGNKWELAWSGGVDLAVEGTDYTAEEQAWPVVLFTCTDGQIGLSFGGSPLNFTVPSFAQGKLPAGWGMEANVLTGEVTTPPYELGGGGTGGAGGSGGTGGSGAGGTGGSTGGTGGTGNAGAGGGAAGGTGGGNTGGSAGGDAGGPVGGSAGSTVTPPPGDGGGDDGGCSTCSTGHKGGSSGFYMMLGLLTGLVMVRRRRQ